MLWIPDEITVFLYVLYRPSQQLQIPEYFLSLISIFTYNTTHSSIKTYIYAISTDCFIGKYLKNY